MNSTLVTGGTGFIGSHTCITLLNSYKRIILLDSLINSSKETIQRIKVICNLSTNELSKRIRFVKGDIRSFALLDEIFF